MEKIQIERYDDDPEALGRVYAESGRWELIIDKENIPHLYVQTNVESDGEGSEVIKGMFCIEDMLPEDFSIQDIMESTFGGKCSPEDEAAAAAEWNERHTANGIPCPRHTNKYPADKDAKYPTPKLATWSEAQIRQTYAFEGLPPTDDIDRIRIELAKLRKPKTAA